MISVNMEPINLSLIITANKGITTITTGIDMLTKNVFINNLRPGNFIRPMTYAAGAEISIMPTLAVLVYTKLLKKYLAKF
ncbi:unnamed protein product [marine sediment metagenome]|uniref:Uncharacterized protein n=1 Tax=marine sediment metagenome TaxID=412755 RepID=X1C3S6_9ZZZZ